MWSDMPADAKRLTNNSWMRGKVGLVTGATGGIGRSLALRLSQCGVEIIIHGRSQARIESVISGQTGFRPVVGDLESSAGCKTVEQAIEVLEPDLLVLNAGAVSEKKPSSELTDEEVFRMFEINLLAPVRLARTFARLPKREQDRRLVLILSTSCFFPRTHMSLYIAAKTGLMGFGRVLQQESREIGIRTLLIFPGRTDTGIRPDKHPEYMSPDSVAEAIVSLLSLPDDLVPYEFIFRPPTDTLI